MIYPAGAIKLPNTFRPEKDLETKTAQLLEESNIPKEDPFVSEDLEKLIEQYDSGELNYTSLQSLLLNNGYKDSVITDHADYYYRCKDDRADILIESKIEDYGFNYVATDADKSKQFCLDHFDLTRSRIYNDSQDLRNKFAKWLSRILLYGSIFAGLPSVFAAYNFLGVPMDKAAGFYILGAGSTMILSMAAKKPLFNLYWKYCNKKVDWKEKKLEKSAYTWVKDPRNSLVEAFS